MFLLYLFCWFVFLTFFLLLSFGPELDGFPVDIMRGLLFISAAYNANSLSLAADLILCKFINLLIIIYLKNYNNNNNINKNNNKVPSKLIVYYFN